VYRPGRCGGSGAVRRGKQWHTLSYFAGCQPVASSRRVTRKPASEEGAAGGAYDACLSGTAVVPSFGAFSTGALGGATAAFGSAVGRCRGSGQGRLTPRASSEGTGPILGDGLTLGAQLEHPAPETVPKTPHAPAETPRGQHGFA